MRQAAPVEPEALVVADGVDDQRVAFPPADRVAVVGGREVGRVDAAVHVDGPVGVRSADVEDVDALRVRAARRTRRRTASGTGARSPDGLQRVCGSSSCFCRSSYTAFAHGWNGTLAAGEIGSRMPNTGSHTPLSFGVAPPSNGAAGSVARGRFRRRGIAAAGCRRRRGRPACHRRRPAASALPSLGTLSALAALLGCRLWPQQRDGTAATAVKLHHAPLPRATMAMTSN